MITVLTIFGTRPEAIKLAPVIRCMGGHPDRIRSVICTTAQHRKMLDQVLDFFRIRTNFDLNLMSDDQSLSNLTAKLLTSLDGVIQEIRPDWILVQGDTTTCLTASIAGFYHRIRIGHVEAGLRTWNKHAPFPEEVNRRLTSVVADIHFAPTETARNALLREGITETSILITGNTVIDALMWAIEEIGSNPPDLSEALSEISLDAKVLLVTGHRRESFGAGLNEICMALKMLASRNPDIIIIYPVHLNPNVRRQVLELLGSDRNIHLTEPLTYPTFVWLMKRAHLILTDSGGIQEEAPSLGKPVIVMRETTERPEGIASGCAVIAGTERNRIVRVVEDLMGNAAQYKKMCQKPNPYGDGQASRRIVDHLLSFESC